MSVAKPDAVTALLGSHGPGTARGERLSAPEVRRQLQKMLSGLQREMAVGASIEVAAGLVTRADLEAALQAELAVFDPLDAALAEVERVRDRIARARRAQLALLGVMRQLMVGHLGRDNRALAAFGIPVQKPRRKLSALGKALKSERQRKTRAENAASRSRKR